jgi:hypothetical protein
VRSKFGCFLLLLAAMIFRFLGSVESPCFLWGEYKIEPTQVLEVNVKPFDFYHSESFYGRIGKDGRIKVPWLVLDLLRKRTEDRASLTGQVMEVTIALAARSSSAVTEQ